MPISYQKISTAEPKWEYIARTNEDGSISNIPIDAGNSDYQAYLAEQSTPIPTE
jgi:hypothetical protein